jgi:hypothetical protein
MEITAAIAALAALVQDNRLDTYRRLVQAGPAGMPAGIDHLGIQVEDDAELSNVSERLDTTQTSRVRGRSDDLLLCAFGKMMDRGPRRHCVGSLTTGESTVYGKSTRKDSFEAQTARPVRCAGRKHRCRRKPTCCR